MMKFLVSVLAALPCLILASLRSDGQLVTLNKIKYYVDAKPIARLQGGLEGNDSSCNGLYPLTVIETRADHFRAEDLINITSSYQAQDDVFQSGFLETVYLRSSEKQKLAFDEAALARFQKVVNNTILISAQGVASPAQGYQVGAISPQPPKGPYFVSATTNDVYRAYRLFDDENLAFVSAVIAGQNGSFTSLPASMEGLMTKTIAVPSRLYYEAIEKQPLAGLRFGVEDIYHVKGLRTSGGNRAYYNTYGEQNVTAPSVQRLIDLGAVLVRKMGTVQFANGDRVTADWVDLHAPFNPRGDGAQNPSGSSTGPSAGIAAYDWLDLTIGSDTGGSMRGPAGSQGVFGNRPSTGAISMDHVIPLSPVSNSAGLFSRSGSLWAKATKAWYSGMRSNYTAFPRSLYRTDASTGAWSSEPPGLEATSLIDAFISGLEGFLGVNSTQANYTERWLQTHGNPPESLAEMLNLTYAVFVSRDQWEQLGQPLFRDYTTQHNGRRPYINPGPLSRWQWGQINANYTVYAQGLRNMTMFKDWWETEGFGRHDTESCSEGVYIYPWSTGAPSYRDNYFSAPRTPPLGFDDSSIPVMAGAPEVVVPVGEVQYRSRVTLQDEWLPVTMAIRMARGCDCVLADLLQQLEVAGDLRPVATGPRLYP